MSVRATSAGTVSGTPAATGANTRLPADETSAYDANGGPVRKTAKTVNGVAERTVPDGDHARADTSPTGAATTRYASGDKVDEIRDRAHAAGGPAWYPTDRLGSARALAGPGARC